MEPVPFNTQRKGPATIRDVAQRAGVGVGTVSRVLNGGDKVRPTTLQRVHKAIEELGFRPSPAARALSRGRASTIGVTAPHLTRPSVVERLRGVVETLGTSAYDLGLATVETAVQRARRISDLCQRDRVDGAIIISLAPTEAEAARLVDAGVRTVVVDASTTDFPSIVIDDVDGGRLATEHLLALGHTRIAFIGDTPEPGFDFTSSADRLQGYQAAMRAAGVPLDDALVVAAEHSRDPRVSAGLLALGEPPTAIFASSDTQALGVLDAARLAGLRVPEDLSVVGFDDLDLAGYVGLTTVRQPLFESGQRAAELLLDLVGRSVVDATAPTPITLDLELVERHTTGPPRPHTSRSRPVAT